MWDYLILTISTILQIIVNLIKNNVIWVWGVVWHHRGDLTLVSYDVWCNFTEVTSRWCYMRHAMTSHRWVHAGVMRCGMTSLRWPHADVMRCGMTPQRWPHAGVIWGMLCHHIGELTLVSWGVVWPHWGDLTLVSCDVWCDLKEVI